MSKLVIRKTQQANQIKQKYAANAYTIREYFRTAVVCRSIEISSIPENERVNYLGSVLISELSPKCKTVIKEKLYAILYSEGLAFEHCDFKVDNGWFTNTDSGCMVTIATKQVDGKLLIAAATCEATQQQNSFRFLTRIFNDIMDMTTDHLKILLKAICVETIEAKHNENNWDYIEFQPA